LHIRIVVTATVTTAFDGAAAKVTAAAAPPIFIRRDEVTAPRE